MFELLHPKHTTSMKITGIKRLQPAVGINNHGLDSTLSDEDKETVCGNLGRCIIVKNNYRKIIVIAEIIGYGKIDSLGNIELIYYRYRIVSEK